MTTATAEPPTEATVPHDPEATAIENQLADVPIGDLGIDAATLDLCVKVNINSVGKFLDKTNNGDNPKLLAKAGFSKDVLDDIVIKISEKRKELKEAAKPKKSKKQLPPPTNGNKGYERKFRCKVGRVSIGKTTVSCGIKVPIKGEDGKP